MSLFRHPGSSLFTFHGDIGIGASRVYPDDDASLGLTTSFKGIYQFSGITYASLGIGVSRFASHSRPDALSNIGSHVTTAVQFPVGIGIMFSDNRILITNGVDFVPSIYLDGPPTDRFRRFAWGVAPELGFHILAGNRLRLGLLGKLQLIQSHDRDEHTDLPRFGMFTFGVLFRYD